MCLYIYIDIYISVCMYIYVYKYVCTRNIENMYLPFSLLHISLSLLLLSLSFFHIICCNKRGAGGEGVVLLRL